MLRGRKVLITGASGEIGAATAQLLASMGAIIILHYHQNEKRIQEIKQKIEKNGQEVYLVAADLTQEKQVKEMFSYIKEMVGGLDVLVNNAGMSQKAYLKFLSEELWNKMIDTNLKSAYLCSKYALQMLNKSEDSCIVNVASFTAFKVLVGETAYSVSKAGMIALTKTLAREAGSFQVRVNAVAPGPVQTESKPIKDEKEAELKKLIPLKRIGTPEDVANSIALLSSPMASFITGQVLVVDGGLSL